MRIDRKLRQNQRALPMNENNLKEGRRVRTSVALRPDQDRWLTEIMGERGNLSALFQNIVDAMRDGTINVGVLMKTQKDYGTVLRAEAYLKVKEASMLFEEDVGEHLTRWLGGRHGMRVVRNRIHNGGTTFISDFSIERENGGVVLTVSCKSNSRPDRLQLALAEAMIGNQKTGKPVVTVIPYLTEDSVGPASNFKSCGYKLTLLEGLGAALDAILKKS